MNYRSDNPDTDWPDTMLVTYRSEAFAEDLETPPAPPTAGWRPLERLIAALPLICLLAPVADAYLIH